MNEMNWMMFASALAIEAQKTVNEAMESPNKTEASVTAALAANLVLNGMAKAILALGDTDESHR